MESDEERNRRLFERLEKMVPQDLVWKAVVGIIVMRGSRPGIQGTGTLLKVIDEHFLITAEHVIHENPGRFRILLTDTADTVPLEGEGLFGEDIDVGVVHLTEESAKRIPPERFLRLDQFAETEGSDQYSLFAVFGFPELFFDADKPSIMKYFQLAHRWEGDPTTLQGYSKLFHFHIGADIDDMIGPDGKPIDFTYRGYAVPAPFPKELKGISGGSVWKVGTIRQGRHVSVPPKIVGIECEVFQDARCIRAVRWGPVAAMIRDALPDDVDPAFDLWHP